MKVNCVIGIDPGANGGIAVFVPGEKVKTVKMPKELPAIVDFLRYYSDNYNPIVFLEELSVRPDDIAVSGGSANMGKLYRIQKMIANFEQLKALIITSGVPLVLVHPATWQSKLRLRVKGQKEEKADRKRRYQQKAGELYGEVSVTLWNADALMIMHFGRWALVNDLKWVRSKLTAVDQTKIF